MTESVSARVRAWLDEVCPGWPAREHPGKVPLYRAFAEDGTLLYVGITMELSGRFTTHFAESQWIPDVRRLSVEWLPSRLSALAAETAAIVAERPLHNVAGTPRDVRLRANRR